MPDRLDELLAREPFAILDGGLASELERDGCDLDDPLWSAKVLLEDPARLGVVHRRFVEAGADIVTTASYQATVPGLRERGLDEPSARALLRESVRLARAGAFAHTLIAASIGSYGAYLADGSEYRGGYGLDRAALVEFHRARLDALLAEQPDLLAFETIPDAIEIEAIAQLLDGSGPRAWVSLSLSRARVQAISDGTPLRDAVAPLLNHPRVAALGVNCVGPSEVAAALEILARVAPGVALVAYPNSGERWSELGWVGEATQPECFTRLARGWVELGARLVGGCCQTGPGHIRALVGLREQQRAGQIVR